MSLSLAPASPAKLSLQGFRTFARFVTEHTGIKMPDNKLPMLESRLQRRLRMLGLGSLEEYREYLFHSPHAQRELAQFIDAVTTNKTDFFREPQHFDWLAAEALPTLHPGGKPWCARVWCAGCSSGEEPYTLAMVLSEYAVAHEGFEFQITATDISTRVLQIATDAIYDQPRIEPVPQAYREKYLLRSRNPAENLVRVAPELRRRVIFQRLNFMDADYRLREVFDVIFFRNVMIYFDKETQQRVLQQLCRHLRPGGFLFVGHSESLMGLELPLEPTASAVYRRLGGVRS